MPRHCPSSLAIRSWVIAGPGAVGWAHKQMLHILSPRLSPCSRVLGPHFPAALIHPHGLLATWSPVVSNVPSFAAAGFSEQQGDADPAGEPQSDNEPGRAVGALTSLLEAVCGDLRVHLLPILDHTQQGFCVWDGS